MGFLKNIKETRQIVEKIDSFLSSETVRKAKAYDELMMHLSHISFTIDKIIETVDEVGETQYFITYKSPTVTQCFDEKGDPIKNDFIYSINMLNLVSLEDFDKFNDAISKVKLNKIFKQK